MKRTYQGKYFYFGVHGQELSCGFRMETELDEHFNFTGTVWEEEFSGISGKLVPVKGFIDNDHISFVKMYPCMYTYNELGNPLIDESKRGHHVIYDGYWDEVNGNWTGEWEIEGETEVFRSDRIETSVLIGNFEMKMEK